MNPMNFNMMWMFPIFPFIMMVLCLLIVYLIFGRNRSVPPCCGSDYYPHQKDSLSAMEILKKRYASGEISKDEFELMKKEIM